MKKRNWITLIIIIAVIVLAYSLANNSSNVDKETAKCIGENSILYTQLGCHACEIQEGMFGKNMVYMDKIDCFYEREKCTEIIGTPTWIIEETDYRGVQSIERLKELTGC
ncbi:hypothetical protein CMI44_02450 [Candidatus Pacearchaeota archaeon]|jgi:hypothetical protein|nr:hypothetical protein [Candidatus Pacearchaeota archaeon]